MKKNVIIITGAGSGIGAATAKLMAENGATIIVTDINSNAGQKVASEIQNEGGIADSMILDVSSPYKVKELMGTVMKKYGRIDCIVNNAGVGSKEMVKTGDHSLEAWDRVISINQSGVFYCMKYALQIMEKQGHGNIVNVASLAGLKASGHNIAYSASKFAVVGLTKSAALEYARKNIRINCVCPGYTHSALLYSLFETDPSLEEKLLRYIPMRRYGEALEVAEAILWLASEKTSFITGQAITIDGGTSL